MQIRFLGAAQTVTGSQHLLEINGKRIMLDCGLYQGRRQEAIQRNRAFQFPVGELNAVILSHAHIDHSGNLPNLVKNGYRGPIYAQRASSHLTRIMLEDSAHIQESDAQHINRKHAKRGLLPVKPLYTTADAAETNTLFVEKDYNEAFEVMPGVMTTFVEAGHILGSTAIVLDIEERGRQQRFWFSGDIGRPELPLIKDPLLPSQTDTLLMECTYGDRRHPSPAEAYEQLRGIVSDTLGRGGKVIIPAFAVGRTQEIVYDLHRMMDAGEVPQAPVFVDSPLAVNVSDIFRAHPECFDKETLKFLESDEHREALGFEMLTYIRSVEESKALNERKEPMIIISASGMMEVGRVLHHVEHNVHDPNSVVLIVSWMAPHTLGRRLVEGETRIRIFGEVYERKIRVAHIDGFSAHAGQNGLMDYAKAIKEQVKNIFLVHGEPGPAQALTELLGGEGFDQVYYPEWGSVAEI
ncbi:MAG TPA: MBL fold metallo-hydrolase [Anaerolineales bacterium]|jgi:metallo-beta-lactamase family protein|nr:MBL fold metallo-hydrolase [Anaerolineales bacterium]